jgi:hypothetical protein
MKCKGICIEMTAAGDAASQGHLDVISWLIDNSDQHIPSISYKALVYDNVDSLKFCVYGGYVSNYEECYFVCANYNSLKCAHFLVTNCPAPAHPEIILSAILFKNLEMIKLMYQAGCPFNLQDCIDKCDEVGDCEGKTAILQWLDTL